MDIHKPKPFHNLREFASEVLIVVVGVAIALAGEQAVEWWSWHNRAGEARQAIALELGTSVGGAEGRVNIAPCVARRLDFLARTVEQAAVSGHLPPLGHIPRPPYMAWESDVWRSAQASQAAAHLGGAEQRAIASAYGFTSLLRELNDAERVPWARLAALAGTGRAFSAADATAMRSAIAEAADLNARVTGSSLRLREQIDIEGIRFSARNERGRRDSRYFSARDCVLTDAAPADGGFAADILARGLAATRADPLPRGDAGENAKR